MKKRALYWILSIMMVLSLVGMVACKDGKDPKNEPKVTLSESTVVVGLFDTVVLQATTENTEESVAWSSSDATVATVVNGIVSPVKAGTTTITAAAGKASATCTVTVEAPRAGSLIAEAGMTTLALKVGDNFSISPKAWYEDKGANGDYLEGGSFTFTKGGANPDAITVNANGEITAVQAGSATVTVGGTIKGVQMTTSVVHVTVTNRFEIRFEDDEVALELGDNNKKTLTLAPKYFLNGAEVAASTITSIVVESEDSEIVSVNGATLTAVGTGIANVTFKATAADGTQEEVELTVSVTKTVVDVELNNEILLNLSDVANFNLTGLGVAADATTLTLDGIPMDAADYSLVEGVFTANATMQRGEDMVLSAENATHIYNVKITLVDMVISDVDSLNTFFVNYRTWGAQSAAVPFYVVVTADIDASSWERTAANNTTGTDKWIGTLNGRGHTIANFNVGYSFIGRSIEDGGKIKNLALVNVTKSENNVVGLIGNTAKNGGGLENVYVQGAVTATSLAKGALWHWFDTASEAYNVVANITVPEYFVDHPAWSGRDGPQYYGVFDHLYVITTYNNGYLRGDNENCTGAQGVYTTVAQMGAAQNLEELLEIFGDDWKIVGDALIFKSAEQFLPSTKATTNFTIAPDSLGAGDADQFAVAAPVIEWKIVGDNVEGITIDENGLVTVADTVAVGTTFKVEAYINDVIFGKVKGAETEVEIVSEVIRVGAIDDVTLEIVAGGTMGNTYTVEVDLVVNGTEATPAGVTLAAETEGIVAISGTTITAAGVGTTVIAVTVSTTGGYSKTVRFNVTVVQINGGEYASAEEVIIDRTNEASFTIAGLNGGAVVGFKPADGEYMAIANVRGENMSGTVYTATHYYTISNLTVVDIVIENGADWKTAFEHSGGLVVNTNLYAIVGNSFDATGVSMTRTRSWFKNVVINGRGNTIYGLEVDTMFGASIETDGGANYHVTIKNLAFFVNKRGRDGLQTGFMGYNHDKFSYDNCYFSITLVGGDAPGWNTHTATAFHIAPDQMTNTVIHITNPEYATKVPTNLPAFAAKPAKSVLTNLHVICAEKGNGYLYDEVTDGVYASIDAFKTAAAAEGFMNGFNSYWKLVNGVPMFATSEQFVYKTGTMSGAETLKQNSNTDYTVAGATVAEWEVAGENLTDITIDQNGHVVVGKTATVGATFTVNAYANSVTFGKYLVASKTVTVEQADEFVDIEAIANQTIYTVQAEGYANSVTVDPVVTVNEVAMVGGTVVLSTDSDVVTINGMTITAAKAGTATILVKATTAKGAVQTITFTVTVAKTPVKVVNANEIIVDFNSATPATISLTDLDITGEFVANSAYTITDGVLTFAASAPRGEFQEIAVETATHAYIIPNVTIVDFVITDKASLDAAGAKMKARTEIYAIVTQSFDYGGTNEFGLLAGDPTARFYGVFNGRGNTIHNINFRRGFTYDFCGTLKNIAFTAVVQDNYGAGMLGCIFRPGSVVENVYVQGTHTGNDGINVGANQNAIGVIYDGGPATFTNVVIHYNRLEQNAGNYAFGNISVGAQPVLTNLFVIVNGGHHNGYLYGSKNSDGTMVEGSQQGAEFVFDNASEWIAYNNTNNVLAAMNGASGNFWAVKNGVVMAASAVGYVNATTAEVVGADTIKQAEGATYTATGATKWALENAPEGVTINAETGAVSVAKTATGSFTVKAYAVDSFLGEFVVGTKVVTIEEVAEVVVIEAIANQTIYAAAAEGYANTVTVAAPAVTVDGVEMVGGSVVLSTESDVITIDGYTITAVKAGTAIITVTATTAAGTVQTTTFTITVAKTPVEVENPAEVIFEMTDADTLEQSVTGMTTDAIVAIKVNGVAQEGWTYNEGVVAFTSAFATRGELLDVVFETETRAYTVNNLTFVDLNVETPADLDLMASWFNANLDINYKYVIVTKSFHHPNGENWANGTKNQSWVHGLKWNGRGNTISGLHLTYGLMYGIEKGAFIKNLAIVNAKAVSKSGIGAFMSATETGSYIENVYFEADEAGKGYGAAANTGFITNVKVDTYVKDVVSIVRNGNNGDTNSNVGFQTIGGAIDNIHAVMVSNRGYSNYLYGDVTAGAYRSVDALKTAAAAEGFLDAFDNKADWVIYDGVPMFKTATQFYVPAQDTITGDDVVKQATTATYAVGASVVSKWEVAGEDLTGISVNQSGVVSVTTEATLGATFTLNAYTRNVLGGEYLIAQKTITVGKADRIVVDYFEGEEVTDDMEMIVEFTNAESNLLPIGELEIQGAFVGIKVNGAEVASNAYEYNAETGTVVFVEGKFPYGEYVDFSILTETHEYLMNGVFTFVTKEINGAEDLDWLVDNYTAFTNGYFIVTKSFAYGVTNEKWTDMFRYQGAYDGTHKLLFQGVWNGRGNVISEMTWKNSFIGRMGEGAKFINQGFTGIIATNTGWGGVVVGRDISSGALVKNIYVEATIRDTSATDYRPGIAYDHCAGATIENVVAKIDGRTKVGTKTATDGAFHFCDGTAKNVYMITDSSKDVWQTARAGVATPANCGVHVGLEAFASAVNQTELLNALNADGAYWAINETTGTVVFASTLPKAEPEAPEGGDPVEPAPEQPLPEEPEEEPVE